MQKNKKPVRALRYGASGTGKTVMAGSWGAGKVLVLNFADDRSLENLEGYEYVDFSDDEKDPRASDKQMRRLPKGFMEADILMRGLLESDDKPDVVVLDDLSGLHDCAMNLALNTTSTGYSNAGGPGMAHYGQQMHYVDEFIEYLRAGPWHLDVIGHERVFEDELGGMKSVHLDMTGKKPDRISRKFDEFYHHEIERKGKDIRYVVRTRPSGVYSAKSRLSWDAEKRVNKLGEKEDITDLGWGGILEKLGVGL